MPKICLICDSGGHLNQIIKLLPYLKKFDVYFVIVEKNDKKVLPKKIRTYFVTEPKRNIFNTIKNFIESHKIFKLEKPDVVISTGAGSALATLYLAKLFGKKVIFIESFSRFDTLSLTGKLVYPIADKFFVQWKSMLKYKKAEYFGQILKIEPKKYKKEKNTIFLTVGTSSMPFDRLIKLVDNLAENELKDYKIFGQIGNSNYIPINYEYERFLTTKEMCSQYKKSEIVICHAGTGSVINALNHSCKVFVMPRLKKYKEHFDDHQLELTKNFIKMNLIKPIEEIKYFKSSIEFKKKEEINSNLNIDVIKEMVTV